MCRSGFRCVVAWAHLVLPQFCLCLHPQIMEREGRRLVAFKAWLVVLDNLGHAVAADEAANISPSWNLTVLGVSACSTHCWTALKIPRELALRSRERCRILAGRAWQTALDEWEDLLSGGATLPVATWRAVPHKAQSPLPT